MFIQQLVKIKKEDPAKDQTNSPTKAAVYHMMKKSMISLLINKIKQ